MKLADKIRNMVTPEPTKSFIKAGIVGSDGNITQEGKDALLEWLLHLYADQFKTDVVDKLLTEEK